MKFKKLLSFVTIAALAANSVFGLSVYGAAPETAAERASESRPSEMPEGGTPPEIPGGQNNGETPPPKPEGQTDGQPPEGGMPPEMPGNQNGGPDFGGTELPFEDVAEDAWYRDAVSQMYGMGIIKGTSSTEFSPDKNLSTGEILTILCRSDGGLASDADENPYSAAAAWAEENRLFSGNLSLAENLETPITREDMMLLIYNWLVYKTELPEGTSDLTEFIDASEVSDYAKTAVSSLAGAKIILGDGAALHPKDTLTRAEAAAILSRIIKPSPPPFGGGMPGGDGEVTRGTAANTLSEDGDISGETYESFGDDENALRIEGAKVNLDNVTVIKSGGASSSTESGDFYGQNAALLAADGATVTIKNGKIESDAQNGNGVFSYGSGTTVNISDTTIATKKDNSGGIQTTGGGTTNAQNLIVETEGNSSAAIRSDRGGGTVTVSGGTYKSKGFNSPAIYSTAAITVGDAELAAENSEALVIEGKNSISLENCDVSGNMSATQGASSDENVHNVMIYQSMSGDAEEGTSEFSMEGGKLIGNSGDMIYVTNTDSVITLKGVEILNKDKEGLLLRVTGNSGARGWGTPGDNGARLKFTGNNQTLEGDIAVDTVSAIDINLENNSNFTGTVNIIENEQGGKSETSGAAVTIDESSTWTLTGDCTVTSLENRGKINYNGHKITLSDGSVLSE